MGAEIDLAESDIESVFSGRTIRSHLGERPDIARYKQTLRWGRQRLYEMFVEGASAHTLVSALSFLVDELLREAWRHHIGAEGDGPLALVAVGGYGRSELLPHSDVDVMVLVEPEQLDAQRAALEAFLTFLWDIGLEVGSSVRSVADCRQQAQDDLTVITNLTEARLLSGSDRLFAEMQQALRPSRIWPVRDFYEAKLAEQRARHAKYDDTGYKLEPNVKEGPGGLRDIHTIGWVAKRHFGAQTLYELREHGFLTKQEADELFTCQEHLWRVRFALHMLTGRREDRLLFDHQVKVAELFGYVDQDHNLAVEQFMKLYYRTIKSLSRINDLLLQLFDEAILDGLKDTPPEPINERFQKRGNVIEARSPDVFRRWPHALIEIFRLMQKHPEVTAIRADTLRLLRRDRRLVDQALRDDLRARAQFIGMFHDGTGLTRTLRRMNRYGVLGRYLPVFGKIIGHMQYDLFHTLTVDEHSLYVVRNLRRMALPQFAHELPFCHEVMSRQRRPELLYIAGLFHDIAKGRGGDHSELGAEDAIAFCREHGLSADDTDLVAWLVRNHLLMSMTAQRMDIHDPKVITDFATKVGDRRRLDYLFLLTCADIRATNPKLWNSWRESLLMELYQGTARTLERGLGNPIRPEELVHECQQRALARLAQLGLEREDVAPLWARFDEDYFLRHSPDELAWHAPAIRTATDGALPVVLVREIPDRGTTLFLYTRDEPYLFGRTTGVLARLGLNILDARINTTPDGYTLDSYVFIDSETVTDRRLRHQHIVDAVRQALSAHTPPSIEISRRPSRQMRHFNTPTTVYFAKDENAERTVLELITADRPGLLSLVGRVFAELGVVLEAAKIGTIGERAEDIFFVTDDQGRELDAGFQSRVRARLIDVLHAEARDPTPTVIEI